MKWKKLIKADINPEDQKELENLWLDNIEKSVKHNYKYIYETTGHVTANVDPNANLDQREFEKDFIIPGESILEAIYGEDAFDKDISESISTFNENGEVTEALKAEDENFLEFIDSSLKNIVTSINLISLGVDHEVASARYKIITNKMLNENEMKQLKEYMDGQMSDGIGEGFEQQEFKVIDFYSRWDLGEVYVENPDYRTDDSENYDEDDDVISDQEFITVRLSKDVKVPVNYFVSLWSPNFRSTIKFMGEEK